MADRRLTVKQVAGLLGASVHTVYRRIYAGELEAEDLALAGASQPTYRVAESALDAYLARQRINRPVRRVA